MRKEELKELIELGHEIEFKYKGKKYSITYYNDKRKKYISFCEFYKEPVDVSKVDELLELKIKDIKLSEIFELLKEEDIDIY